MFMSFNRCQERGFTLLEVLITIVILAFGLLGLTNLQAKLHMSQMESYQRAQAVVLLQDFANRIQANGGDADDYVTDLNDDGDTGDTDEWLGTGDDIDADEHADCEVDADYPDTKDKDRCHWSVLLRGAAELDEDDNPVGGMIGARGCVEALPVGAGSCAPSSYRITVAWQGLFETAAPGLTCAAGQYGANDALRRAISTTVTVGLPKCLP